MMFLSAFLFEKNPVFLQKTIANQRKLCYINLYISYQERRRDWPCEARQPAVLTDGRQRKVLIPER